MTTSTLSPARPTGPSSAHTAAPAYAVTPPRAQASRSASAATYGTYGTDRGSWLAGLRARAAADALTTAPGVALEPVAARAVADSSWELDGLLTSAGRLDL